MEKRIQLFLLCAFGALHLFGTEPPVISSVSELKDACNDLTHLDQAFDIEGNIYSYFKRTLTGEWIFSVHDGKEIIEIYELNRPGHPATNLLQISLNDRVRLQGVLYEYEGHSYPGYQNIKLVAPTPTSQIPIVSPSELYSGNALNRLYRLRGTIRDSFRDEGDPNFIFLSMNCRGETLHFMLIDSLNTITNSHEYTGREIIVAGLCMDSTSGLRRHMGRMLFVSGPENITILNSKTNASYESRPDIGTITTIQPSDYASLGPHQASGTVLAAWQNDSVLLQTSSGNVSYVRFDDGPMPSCGQRIRVFGLPETDLYFINLAHASWSPLESPPVTLPACQTVSPMTLLTNQFGRAHIDIRANGKPIRLLGTVRYLPAVRDRTARLHLESDGELVPVDVSANLSILDQVSVGDKIAASGTCVIDFGSREIGSSVPKAKGFFLVPRTPDDIVVLSRPSWWTPFRLMCVIGALVFVLVAILVWNTMLRRLAERRGQELADEQVKSVTSELKVYERTHLAVELHDSLSQTLSGVSMQIDAVKRFAESDPARMNRHLGIAAKTLKSCRDELRNCLLDLRSNALEEPDMNAAIRKTLEPYLDDADIAIRFFIPREIFSDNTAHTVLRIVRELVVNALRHGKADKIRIAGSIEGRTLMFSVRDNGCGFEPDNAPGIADGHFGLQGIRERIDELSGTLEIASTLGKGCKAIVTIELTQDTAEDTNV